MPGLKILGFWASSPFSSASLFSCGPSDSGANSEKKDSLVAKLDVPRFDIRALDDKPGIAGVFDVPEMLSLCKLDSGKMSEVSQKVING